MAIVPESTFSWYIRFRHEHCQVFERASVVTRRHAVHPSMLNGKFQRYVSRQLIASRVAFAACEKGRLGVREYEVGVVLEAADFEADPANRISTA